MRNDFNALAVGGTGAGGANNINLTNDSIWDQTDITYLLRTSIIPAGDFFGSSSFNLPPIGGVAPPLGPELKPTQTLTIQSALPDTVLATGQKIPRPGESIIIKTINTGGAVPGDGLNGSSNADYGGAGFLFGVDDGIDPPADPTIDQGNKSVLRILGIGGNETTGQQRVPVIITSIHDNTVGSTVRGIAQNQVVSGDVTAPKAGDGGLIYFGGNAGIGYNAFDVREGNKIDNADIHFLTRVEMQGGGVINYIDSNASNSFDIPDGVDFTKRGVFPNLLNGQPDPRNAFLQGNANKQLTISNSNLSNFSSAGIVEHPGFQLIAGGVRTSFNGQPNLLFLYNNTISNVPIGVRVVGQNGPNTNFPDVTELLLLNNTFYNDGVGVDLQEVSFDGTNSRAHVHLVAMDNIFSSSSTAAIRDIGQSQGSLLEYNLFFTNSANILDLAPVSGNEQLAGLNFQPIFGDPKFRDPANGNLQLLEGSAAIDSGRDELSLNPDAQGAIVGTLIPIATQVLDARGGIRNNNSREPDSNNFDLSNIPNNKLTLPGYPTRGYVDQFVPVLQTDPTGSAGPDSSAATFNYAPIDGERDSLGYLRQKDPNSSNVGFGLKPYFDLGAYEFRALFPPHVTNVTATVADPNNPTNPATTIPLYQVGGDAGTNQTIQTIQVQFDNRIDPNTINERTVLLEASGGDGIFGNNNSANDKFYNLAGKLSFDPNSHILTINIGAAGLNLQNDAYRLFLLGSGSDVLRDPQGNALDGENTLNDDPNNPQLPLPSGDGFPGGNFFLTFTVDTNPPSLAILLSTFT